MLGIIVLMLHSRCNFSVVHLPAGLWLLQGMWPCWMHKLSAGGIQAPVAWYCQTSLWYCGKHFLWSQMKRLDSFHQTGFCSSHLNLQKINNIENDGLQQTPGKYKLLSTVQIIHDKVIFIQIFIESVTTCFSFCLNAECFSKQDFTIICIKPLMSNIAPCGADVGDRLQDGNHFLNCKVDIFPGAFKWHNKCAWIHIFMLHTAVRSVKKIKKFNV